MLNLQRPVSPVVDSVPESRAMGVARPGLLSPGLRQTPTRAINFEPVRPGFDVRYAVARGEPLGLSGAILLRLSKG